MKRLSKLFCVSLFVLLLTGCGSKKEEIDPNKLITISSDKGYLLVDAGQDYDYAKKALKYHSDDTDILFISVDEGTVVVDLYTDQVNNVAISAGENAKTTTDKGNNYSLYTSTNDNDFYVVSRVGKSYICVKTKKSNKKKIIKYLKDINYY